jgi:DNA-binding transcriptional LysR family regulator
MNLRSIDLNLLVILEALVEERSVTKAAQRVGISQSATSHALRRLRITFQDELLVRTGDGMSPTAIALSLANAIGGSLHDIEQAVQGGRSFDPATSTHAFKMRVSDYATMYLLPRLCQRLRQSAPSTRLEVKHFDQNAIDQKVTNEEVQVRLALNATGGDETYRVRLLEDRFVVVMNSDNPARNSKFTLTNYLELDHLKVSIGGVGTNVIDDELARSGRKRKIAMTVPSWLGMQQVIETTDLVAVVPQHWMRADGFRKFIAFPLPIGDISLSIDLVWLARDDKDLAQRWFRELIKDIFQNFSI